MFFVFLMSIPIFMVEIFSSMQLTTKRYLKMPGEVFLLHRSYHQDPSVSKNLFSNLYDLRQA